MAREFLSSSFDAAKPNRIEFGNYQQLVPYARQHRDAIMDVHDRLIQTTGYRRLLAFGAVTEMNFHIDQHITLELESTPLEDLMEKDTRNFIQAYQVAANAGDIYFVDKKALQNAATDLLGVQDEINVTHLLAGEIDARMAYYNLAMRLTRYYQHFAYGSYRLKIKRWNEHIRETIDASGLSVKHGQLLEELFPIVNIS